MRTPGMQTEEPSVLENIQFKVSINVISIRGRLKRSGLPGWVRKDKTQTKLYHVVRGSVSVRSGKITWAYLEMISSRSLESPESNQWRPHLDMRRNLRGPQPSRGLRPSGYASTQKV